MKPAPPDVMGVPASNAGLWNLPNVLTMLRLVLVPPFAYFLLADSGTNSAYRLICAAIFVIASITDFLDGAIARKRGIVTTFGKVADPLADKVLTGVALIGLSSLGEIPWWITLVILGRELAVTVLRFWVIKHGVIPASRGGKAKTVLQIAAIVLFLLPLGGPWLVIQNVVLWAALIVTVVTGVDYTARALKLRADGKAASARVA